MSKLLAKCNIRCSRSPELFSSPCRSLSRYAPTRALRCCASWLASLCSSTRRLLTRSASLHLMLAVTCCHFAKTFLSSDRRRSWRHMVAPFADASRSSGSRSDLRHWSRQVSNAPRMPCRETASPPRSRLLASLVALRRCRSSLARAYRRCISVITARIFCPLTAPITAAAFARPMEMEALFCTPSSASWNKTMQSSAQLTSHAPAGTCCGVYEELVGALAIVRGPRVPRSCLCRSFFSIFNSLTFSCRRQTTSSVRSSRRIRQVSLSKTCWIPCHSHREGCSCRKARSRESR